MKLTVTLLLLCIPAMVWSQRIEVTVGPELDQKEIRKEIGVPGAILSPFRSFSYSSTLFFNPAKQKGYVGFGFKDKSFHFAVFDNYLNYTGMKKLVSETIDEKVKLNAFVIVKGKTYLIFSQENKSRDEFSVYVNEVSDDMVVLGTPIKLHTYKNLKQSGMQLIVSSSEHKDYFLLTRIHDTKARESQKMECKAVSQTFSEVWYKLIDTGVRDMDLVIQSLAVDNSGNMYMLTEQSDKKVNNPVAFVYFWKSGSLKNFELGAPAGVNFGSRLKLLNGERAYIVGLNKDEKKISFFLNRINAQQETLEEVKTGLMPDNFYELSRVRLFDTFDWSISDIVTLDDNSVVASVEAELVNYKYNLYNTYNTYVLSFSESGDHRWTGVVQKKQVVMGGMHGHMLVPAGNNVLVIYNDHEKNITKKTDDSEVEIFKTKNAMVVVQEFDEKGNAKKYPFSKNKELENYALFFYGVDRIEPGLYYSSCINVKGVMSVDTKNIVFKIN